MLPPVVEIFRQPLRASRQVSAATLVTLLQARLNRRPARRLDFQPAHAPVRFPQEPLRPRHRIVLPKPPRFPARVFLQRAFNAGIPSRRAAGQSFKRLERHPRVAGRGQPVRGRPQSLRAFAIGAPADFPAHEPEERPELFDFLPRAVDGRRMPGLPQTASAAPTRSAAHPPHGLGRRFRLFETKRHDRRECSTSLQTNANFKMEGRRAHPEAVCYAVASGADQ